MDEKTRTIYTLTVTRLLLHRISHNSPPAATTTRRMTLHDNPMDSEDDNDGSGSGGHPRPLEPPTHRTHRTHRGAGTGAEAIVTPDGV